MSQSATRGIKLSPLSLPNLRRLVASEALDLPIPAPEGALPPASVASRMLSQLETGTPAFWCMPFLIIDCASGSILGGCGFKGLPVNGCVEVGYGVAKSEQSRGVATAAVGDLIALAIATGIVNQVVAHILPDNLASSKVVFKLGFISGDSVIDADGDSVVRWLREISPELIPVVPQHSLPSTT